MAIGRDKRHRLGTVQALIALAVTIAGPTCRIDRPLDGMDLLLELHTEEARATAGDGKPTPGESVPLRAELAARTAAIIAKRLDDSGISHAVEQLSSDRLRVRVQRLDQPERCRQMIRAPGLLEVHLATFPEDTRAGASREQILAHHGGSLPADVEILLYRPSGRWAQAQEQYLAVEKAVVLSSKDFANVRPAKGKFGQWILEFSLKPEAAAVFRGFTATYQGRNLAFALDGEVRTAPRIQGPIGADAIIEAGQTRDEVEDLAILLRSGPLPVRVTILQERAPAAKRP